MSGQAFILTDVYHCCKLYTEIQESFEKSPNPQKKIKTFLFFEISQKFRKISQEKLVLRQPTMQKNASYINAL